MRSSSSELWCVWYTVSLASESAGAPMTSRPWNSRQSTQTFILTLKQPLTASGKPKNPQGPRGSPTAYQTFVSRLRRDGTGSACCSCQSVVCWRRVVMRRYHDGQSGWQRCITWSIAAGAACMSRCRRLRGRGSRRRGATFELQLAVSGKWQGSNAAAAGTKKLRPALPRPGRAARVTPQPGVHSHGCRASDLSHVFKLLWHAAPMADNGT